MPPQLQKALEARKTLIDNNHTAAFRLFSGFYEGPPDVAADIYARTLLLWGYGENAAATAETMNKVQRCLLEQLPWIECVVQKQHSAPGRALQRGVLTLGDSPARKIRERGLWYAVDLTMNQDASFYLDTRDLRRWFQ